MNSSRPRASQWRSGLFSARGQSCPMAKGIPMFHRHARIALIPLVLFQALTTIPAAMAQQPAGQGDTDPIYSPPPVTDVPMPPAMPPSTPEQTMSNAAQEIAALTGGNRSQMPGWRLFQQEASISGILGRVYQAMGARDHPSQQAIKQQIMSMVGQPPAPATGLQGVSDPTSVESQFGT